MFGLFLLYTAWKVRRAHHDEPNPEGNALMRWVGNHVSTSPSYDGRHYTTMLAGRRALTPLALVILAIGTTDLLFAIDSIPAVFGITSETYLVFTVNAFALMGLRQLYFLLGDVLGRLRYLNRGLAVILGFIGVKLIADAVRATTSVEVPEFPTWVSLAVIVVVLAVTALVSVYATAAEDDERTA